jgi:putative ATP-dependent endonuclease of the OLD family
VRIVRLEIANFRGVKKATLFPEKHNVYLGPNNIGKTSILEALNLLLNPEISPRPGVIDENDFFRREYRAPAPPAPAPAVPAGAAPGGEPPGRGEAVPAAAPPEGAQADPVPAAPMAAPIIRIEAVLTGLSDEDVDDNFASVLVPWNPIEKVVVEGADAGDDPFEGAERAIRPCFEGWYDEDEDDFAIRTFFRTDPSLARDACPTMGRPHKRAIGFLIYRDFRALQRPITLDPVGLFARLLQSQDATPRTFDDVLSRMKGGAVPLFDDENFARVVNEYRQELARYLPLDPTGDGKGHLSFEITDRTREEVKAIAQLYVNDALPLPLQRMGAGTRSLSLLAVLLLIARKRNRGILALEEPETFLFPHAQRRIIDELLGLASQSFITTHSPYVLERMPLDSYQRVTRTDDAVATEAVVRDAKSGRYMRDRHRRQLAEGLLGRAAIVVEEESIRQWILRTSALLHGVDHDGSKRAALELHGVSVLTAEGNGEVGKLVALLTRAGIQAIGFMDQVEEKQLKLFMADDVPLLFHAERNLEDLLSKSLSKSVLETILTTPSAYTKNTYEKAVVAGWTEAELRAKAKEYLRNHKGYLPFHEEILERLAEADVPTVLKRLVCLGETLADGTIPETHTLTSK